MSETNVAKITIAHMRNGEPAITKSGFIYFTCCDCCLVHLIRIEEAEHAKGEFIIAGYRDDFLTEEVRKQLKITTHEEVLPSAKGKAHKVSKG